MPITVAVVEDDARIRRVLGEILSSAEDCQCVGAFSKGVEAIEAIPTLQPGVVIMLIIYQDPETIFQALAAGAHGYLVKPVMPDKLLEAIREIRASGVPMSRTIARKVIEVFRRPAPPPHVGTAIEDAGLGPREQEILEFLVAGLSYKEIAAELSIKVSTVGTYVQRIYEKLHVRSRREIIARCRNPADGRHTGSEN